MARGEKEIGVRPLSPRSAAGLARASTALARRFPGVPFGELVTFARSVEGMTLRLDLAAADAIGVPILVLRETPANDLLKPLSKRERQVARLVAQGLSNLQIAAVLGISVPTVKDHVHSALSKCGLSNRAQLAAESVRSEP